MNAINYLNLFLLLVNFMSFMVISFIYLYFTRQYYNYEVPSINSYNIVISGTEIDLLIKRLKEIYYLQDYEIIYDNTEKYIKLFKNLNRKNSITISKRIFESVGYEIDYIASRIWISQQTIQKNKQIFIYKMTLKFNPYFIIFLMLALFTFNLFLFVYMSGSPDDLSNKSTFFQWLWNYPIISLVFILLAIFLSLNYVWSSRIKSKIEKRYSQEMSKIINENFDQYKIDFHAARVYSESIKLSYMPIYKPNDFWEKSKWIGAFVYF